MNTMQKARRYLDSAREILRKEDRKEEGDRG